jgi:hypothetical protein
MLYEQLDLDPRSSSLLEALSAALSPKFPLVG